MEKFDYKKFLTENKLTKASILREGVGAYEYEKGKAEGEAEEKKKMTKEELKQKIKEMIVNELDGSAVTNSYYDPLDEGSDDEDYEKTGREVEYGVNPNDEKFDLKDFFMDDEEFDDDDIDPEHRQKDGSDIDREMYRRDLGEAKKDEEEAAEEEAPAEEVDATLDVTDTGEDFNIDTSAVDPNIKAVQDALTQAQAAAKNINDDKLTQQIGNTITMFTRTHIANTEKQVNEEMPMMPEEYVVAIEDTNTNTTEVMFTGPKNKALTAYNNIGARYWDNPEARVFIMAKSAFEQNN